MYCAYCGKEMNDEACFCAACGKAVIREKQGDETLKAVENKEMESIKDNIIAGYQEGSKTDIKQEVLRQETETQEIEKEKAEQNVDMEIMETEKEEKLLKIENKDIEQIVKKDNNTQKLLETLWEIKYGINWILGLLAAFIIIFLCVVFYYFDGMGII